MRDCDPEEVKRRREECMVELRSAKRQDRYLQKRGRRQPEPLASEDRWKRRILEVTDDCPHLPNMSTLTFIQRFESLLSTFRDTTDTVVEEDLLGRIDTLASEQDPEPLQYMVYVGIVPKLLRYLESPRVDMALKAVVIVVNLTFASEADIFQAIVNEGGIGLLIKHISSSPEEIADHCIWALSNMVGERDHPKLRELILEAGILEALQPLTDGLRARSPTLVQNMCWLLANLTIDKRPLPLVYADKLCWVLQRCFATEDCTALRDCLLAVYTLTKSEGDLLPVVRQAGLLQACYALLTHEVEFLRLEAVKCIGNFVTFAPDSAYQLLSIGLLDQLLPLVADNSVDIQAEALWLLSSLLADTGHADTVIAHAVFPAVLRSMASGSSKSRQEAIVCVHNLTCARTVPVINSFISNSGLELLCQSLSYPDSKVLYILLGILLNTLETTTEDMAKEARDRIEPFVTALDRLFDHRNVQIKERVRKIYRLLDAQETPTKEEMKTPSVFTFS